MDLEQELNNFEDCEITVIDDAHYSITKNDSIGVAVYQDVEGNNCYYYSAKQDVDSNIKSPFDDFVNSLENEEYAGEEHRFRSFTASKIKILPSILQKYQEHLEQNPSQSLLAFVELVDELRENESNVEQTLNELGLKLRQINSCYKLYKRHPDIEEKWEELSNHSDYQGKIILAFIHLIEDLNEENRENEETRGIEENESNVQQTLKRVGFKGLRQIYSYYKLYKRHPDIEEKWEELSNQEEYKGRQLIAFIHLIEDLNEENRENEETRGIEENGSNVEQTLKGMGFKGLRQINSCYKLYKRHPDIEEKYETWEEILNPVEAVLLLEYTLNENISNLSSVLVGLGKKVIGINISAHMFKYESFEPIHDLMMDGEEITSEHIRDFLIEYRDANNANTRKLFKYLNFNVNNETITTALDESQAHFDEMAIEVYNNQRDEIETLIEQGVNERGLVEQLDLPFYVAKKISELILIDNFPETTPLSEFKRQAIDRGYKLNQHVYTRAFNELRVRELVSHCLDENIQVNNRNELKTIAGTIGTVFAQSYMTEALKRIKAAR